MKFLGHFPALSPEEVLASLSKTLCTYFGNFLMSFLYFYFNILLCIVGCAMKTS